MKDEVESVIEQPTKETNIEEGTQKQKKLPRQYIKTIEEGKGNVIEHRIRSQKIKALLTKVKSQTF